MIEQVSPSELPTWMAQQSAPVVVLDVREPEEIEISSVTPNGFELVLIPMNDVPARMAELDAKRPTAVLCHRGARSQRVAQFLVENGFENVINIAGGISAWPHESDGTAPQH